MGNATKDIPAAGLASCSGGFLQIDVELGDPDRNLASLRRGLADLEPASPGIVVLPEMWGPGFDYRRIREHGADTPRLLEEAGREAARYGIHIAGSLPELEPGGEGVFNTLYILGPDGLRGAIRKRRLFAPMDEDRYFEPGAPSPPVATGIGLLGGMVCFDLRFPELARSHVAQGARLLLVSAQWPAARRDHWRVLLQARAIENQVFVIGCNRSGTTEGTEFGGHSMIVAPNGAVLAEAGEGPAAIGAPLDPDLLTGARQLFVTVD